ncbi:MAG: hypothetical protein OEM52_08440 [bacterium]|nr:hypothetical protein [bacterium]
MEGNNLQIRKSTAESSNTAMAMEVPRQLNDGMSSGSFQSVLNDSDSELDPSGNLNYLETGDTTYG